MYISSLSSSFLAFVFYIILLISIGFSYYKKGGSSTDFIIGSRKMNFWLTALAAHASDMSSWIFLGYPAVVFATGIYNAWLAVGLVIFMFLNWQFVAPKLRTMTEKYNSLTLPSFFESRFADVSGFLRIFTVIISFLFYIIYISSGLVGLGILLETLFNIQFIVGVTIGIFIIVPYLFIGGYVTLAWTDFYQGIFLICVIVLVPIVAMKHIGGFSAVIDGISIKTNLKNLIPDLSLTTIFGIFTSICGWGLGYFGQPHIITKFMGISNVKDMPKSKWIGISWQIISLLFATFIGLVGIAFFPAGLIDNQLLFIKMVLDLFPYFISAFILCSVLGATITSMDSQVLVLASNLTEDFYKKILRKNASSLELLITSRLSIVFVAAISYCIAITTSSTIFNLVSYAWFGLGASFGPLVLFSLYYKKTNKFGAFGGLITGFIISAFWPLINRVIPIEIPTLIPGFIISSFTIFTVSLITQHERPKLT